MVTGVRSTLVLRKVRTLTAAEADELFVAAADNQHARALGRDGLDKLLQATVADGCNDDVARVMRCGWDIHPDSPQMHVA
jgi:hypothetical protein